ncbi:unnamed protein product, partial [Nesidiocoris tenuis]
TRFSDKNVQIRSGKAQPQYVNGPWTGRTLKARATLQRTISRLRHVPIIAQSALLMIQRILFRSLNAE